MRPYLLFIIMSLVLGVLFRAQPVYALVAVEDICDGCTSKTYSSPSCEFPRSQCDESYTYSADLTLCRAEYDEKCGIQGLSEGSIDCSIPRSQCDGFSDITGCQAKYDDMCAMVEPEIAKQLDYQTKLPLAETITEIEKIIEPVFNTIVGVIRPTVVTMTKSTLGATIITAPLDSKTGSSVTSQNLDAAARVGAPLAFGDISTISAPTSSFGSGGKAAIGNQMPMSIQQVAPPFNNLPKIGAIVRSGQQNLNINIETTCFPTNLRGVNNPISANADLVMSGKYYVYQNDGAALAPSDADFKAFEIRYPARAAVFGNAGATPINLTQISFSDLGAGFTPVGYLVSKLVTVKVPAVFSATYDVNTNTITSNMNRFIIKDVNFSQVVPAITSAQLLEYTSVTRWQAAVVNYKAQTGNPFIPEWMFYENWKNSILSGIYMGQTGPVGTNGGSSISVTQSTDGTSYNIKASLPGDLTMCDGYYSPLMVFFDKKRPQFTNISNFKMNHNYRTYWPEADHQGYFIGLPNKNGLIDSYEDLFGEQLEFKNGFEKLAQYDKNKDGVIDAKDSIYKKLVLWKDLTGKGVFKIKDAIKLSQKIKSINLKYANSIEQISIGAEVRQKSSFTYKEQGKVKTGDVVDVWFKPALNEVKPELAGK